MSLVFEWDPRKARTNFLKHSVGFAEATSVFSDPLARIFDDELHSADELRGDHRRPFEGGAPVVGMLHGMGADRVRIISARRGTRTELHDYEGHRKN
jgi:hypothetical protein